MNCCRIVIVPFRNVTIRCSRAPMTISKSIFGAAACAWGAFLVLHFLDLEGTCALQDHAQMIADIMAVACIFVLLGKLVRMHKSRATH